MRLLPVGSGDDGERVAAKERQTLRRRHRRGDAPQYLPLRHLSGHPRRHPSRCRNSVERSQGMNRRDFLKTSAAAGLVLGFHIPGRSATTAPARVNAWVRIAPDSTVTLMIHKGEMGQGTITSL